MFPWRVYSGNICNMPKGRQGAATDLSRAVSAEVKAQLARRRMEVDELAERTGKSRNYLYVRLRDQLPFNLNDLELIAQALGISGFTILEEASRNADALARQEEQRSMRRSAG